MKQLILMIGASGSGKSTLRKKLLAENTGFNTMQVHSWDELRLSFAEQEKLEGFTEMNDVEKAAAAFTLSTTDSAGFSKYYQSVFNLQLKQASQQNGSVLIDNTNTSSKRRNFFITAARAQGFEIIAYLFPNSRQELINRAAARTDHKVPIGSILQQYDALQLPSIGEVDQIRFIFKG